MWPSHSYTKNDIPNLPDDWYISNQPVDYGCIWVKAEGTKGTKRRPTNEEAAAVKEALRRRREEMLSEEPA